MNPEKNLSDESSIDFENKTKGTQYFTYLLIALLVGVSFISLYGTKQNPDQEQAVTEVVQTVAETAPTSTIAEKNIYRNKSNHVTFPYSNNLVLSTPPQTNDPNIVLTKFVNLIDANSNIVIATIYDKPVAMGSLGTSVKLIRERNQNGQLVRIYHETTMNSGQPISVGIGWGAPDSGTDQQAYIFFTPSQLPDDFITLPEDIFNQLEISNDLGKEPVEDISLSTLPTSQDDESTLPVFENNGLKFLEIFSIDAKAGVSPRGYIDSSISGQRFWVEDDKLAFIVTYFDKNNESELHYGQEILPMGTIKPPVERSSWDQGLLIGGKKFTVSNKYEPELNYTLLADGTEYAKGNGQVTALIDYNGLPAYVVATFNPSKPTTMAVMYEGKPISKDYNSIKNLGVVGGKLTYLVNKTYPENLFKLIWNNNEYGTEYDSVFDYIDSAGVPAYMAANYERDSKGQSIPSNSQYLVKDKEVIFSGKQQSEMIWKARELADVEGNVAIIVRSPDTESLYVYYKGKKLFEGYDVNYVRNVNGKLALLVGKNHVQYVYIEN